MLSFQPRLYKPCLFSLVTVAFLLVFCGSVSAQKVTVRGTVRDSASQELLEEATVSLLHLPGPDLIRTVRSRDGFVFSNLSQGKYLMVSTYQGYDPDTISFSIGKKDTASITLAAYLKQSENSLLEVVVHASIPPAIVRSDTIAFNAGAYPSPPNSTLEDLLRKLPGIEIDKDGNVTMQGQKVDKITIDGKDFFLGDLRSASQNLPADIVAQVEAFDTRSEKSKLTGIKDQSKTKTLNIKLKKNRRKGIVGKVYAGAGTNSSYSAGANVTRLSEPAMFFGTGNANNINNQFPGADRFVGASGGVGSYNNLNLNYRDEWVPKLTGTIDGGRSFSNIQASSALSRQTFLTDSSIVQNSTAVSSVQNTNYNGYALIEYAPDSMTHMDLYSNLGAQQFSNQNSDSVSIITQKPGNNYLSSIGMTDNSSSGTGNTISNSFNFRQRLHKTGRTIFFNLSQNSSVQDQTAGLYSRVLTFDSTGRADSAAVQNQQSTQSTRNNNIHFETAYTEPVSPGHLLDFGYSFNRSAGHSDKESFDYDSLTGRYDHLDTLTTNRFQNYTTSQRLNAGYNTTEGKYQFQIGLSAQLTSLSNENLFTGQTLFQNTVNWFPRASLLWELEKGKNLRFNYSGSSISPTIDQLQPLPDLTNPYLIKTGNPDLRQQITHEFNGDYAAFNAKSFQNWQVSLSGDFSQNQITSSSTVLAGGVQELQYVNVQGVYHLNSNFTYGFPLFGQKNGNASVSLRYFYGHDISLVNGQENIASSTGISGLATINFHAGEKLFIDLVATINETRSAYSLPASPTSQTLNENYNLKFSYHLPWSITIGSTYNLQVTGSQGNLPAQAVSLWNASVYKSIFKNRVEIHLSAFDLLNSVNSFSQSTGVNYVQTARTNLPGRLLLASLVWRFSKWSSDGMK
jgi:Outer membrane protein beta-barrel family